MKAEERPCRQCEAVIPAQPSGPGRPREFCSTRCRRDWHSARERERMLAQKRELWERNRYERDLRFYGERRAEELRREREAHDA